MRSIITRLPKQPAAIISIAFILAIFFISLIAMGIHWALRGNALGADFYVYWRAGRVFLLENSDPYGPETMLEIQMGIYGQPAGPDNDPLAFNYPPYAFAVLLPNLLMEYGWAQAFWMAFHLTSILAVFFLMFPNLPKPVLISIPFVYNYAFGIIIGPFSVLISLILIIFCVYFLIRKEKDARIQIISGMLLAWATCKPQFIWLYMIFVLLYCFRNRLLPLLIAFFASWLLMMLVCFLIQPDWMVNWLHQINSYACYTQWNRAIYAPLSVLIPTISWDSVNHAYLPVNVVSMVFTAYLFSRWWQKQIHDFTMFTWLAFSTYLLLPNNSSGDQLALLIPLLVWCLWQMQLGIKSAAVWWIILLIGSNLALVFDLMRLGLGATMKASFIIAGLWGSWRLVHQFWFRRLSVRRS